MQEAEVGWDPIGVHRNPGWAVRLYVFFLLFVLCYTITRCVVLAWNLNFRRVRTGDSSSNVDSVDRLAHAVLRGAVQAVPPVLVVAIGPRFEFLASMLAIHLRSMRQLAVSAILAGTWASAVGVINVLQGFSSSKVLPFGVFSGSLAEAAIPIALGLIFALALSLSAAIFESVLARRRVSWAYHCETALSLNVQSEISNLK